MKTGEWFYSIKITDLNRQDSFPIRIIKGEDDDGVICIYGLTRWANGWERNLLANLLLSLKALW